MTPANAHAEMMTMQYKLIDKFWIETRVDSEHLQFNADRLNMTEDPEYEKMLKEYNEQMQNIE